ncbi:MAG: AEC family transporter [Lachnospiraceae bacterium]|nr:AEC family transporter [Lachnospiraceae bacterium]
MSIFSIIVQQICIFITLGVVGVIAVKTGILTEEALGHFSRYLMRIAIPVMIFTNTINGATRQDLFDSLLILLLAVVMYICLLALSAVLARAFHLQGNRRKVFRAVSSFGNVGFMGIPLLSALFPETGMIYVALFTIIDQSVLWTVGVHLTQPEGEEAKVSLGAALRKMVNPAIVSVLLAVLFVLLGWSLPTFLNTALTSVANTTSPLSMIYIGGLFCFTDVRAYFRKAELYGMVVFKMLLFPILFYLVLSRLPISQEIAVTMTVFAGLPTMSTIPMLATASGSDGEYAVGALIMTTAFSALTLPLLGYIMM